MTMDRRSFLRASAFAGSALGLAPLSAAGTLSGASGPLYRGLPDVPRAPRALRLLVLGGTGFIGPHELRYAVARGHRITIFNRGRSEADIPDGIERLYGDRNEGDLDALKGRSWDVVIDNPTTLPFWVRDAADVLEGNTGQYIFISTISVYDPDGLDRIDERSPRLRYEDGDPLDVGFDEYRQAAGRLYGPLKAASEDEARRRFGEEGTTVVRPGLIVGPGDPTDRFTYWPVRIARGGEILAPGDGMDAVQVIDARDLAGWIIRVAEEGVTGVYNATGPRSPLTMAGELYGIRAALPGDVDLRFTWVPDDFLARHEVRPWSEMTTWFGPGPAQAFSRTDVTRAIERGLTFRPLAVTAADTLGWWRSLPSERREEPRAGLDREKERAVLDAWRRT